MSISNLFNDNDYKLNCLDLNVKGRLKAKISEIEQFIIDQIEVNNAIVNTSVTTPHINSNTTTFNTVGTINLGAINGEIENITSSGLANLNNLAVSGIASFNDVGVNGTLNTSNFNTTTLQTQDLTVTSVATINNANITNTLTADSINSNNLFVTDSTINDLNVTGTLIAPSFNTTTLQTQDLNVTSVGSISNLVVPNIASIADLNVSGTLTAVSLNLTDITCNLLTVNDNATIETANINNGTINTLSGSEFNYDLGYAADLSCKNLRIFSELSECPVGRIDDLTSDIFTNITSMASPSITMGTVASINSTPLTYHYYTNTTTQVSGAINPINVTLLGFRIGNYVSLQVSSSPAQVCTNNAQPLDIAIPFPFRPIGTVRGTCLIRKGPLTNLARWSAAGGLLSVYAGLTSTDFWTLGEVCSLDTGTWNFSWVTNGA